MSKRKVLALLLAGGIVMAVGISCLPNNMFNLGLIWG
jgi:hypothetical protein